MRQLSRIAGLVAAGLILTACAGGEPSESSRSGGSELDGSGSAAADAEDVSTTVVNCGVEVTVDDPPERAVPLNRPATEILLALGLKDRIAAVAGAPDKDVAPQVADDFAELEILVERDYPSSEALLDLEPDFLYAAYPSAYRDDGVGSRDSFAALGIPTYLSTGRCPDRDKLEPTTIEDVWAEIEEIGRLFGVPQVAEDLVAEQRAELDQTRAEVDELLADVPPLSVFWWDMDTDVPFVGACCGAPAMIIETLGFENIFADVEGHWAEASWEQVVERDPDLIVIADFGDGDLDTKMDFLTTDPTLSQLRAVQNDAIVALPFNTTVPGIQTVTTVGVLAEAASDVIEP